MSEKYRELFRMENPNKLIKYCSSLVPKHDMRIIEIGEKVEVLTAKPLKSRPKTKNRILRRILMFNKDTFFVFEETFVKLVRKK